jgi:hypothetical protein
VESADNRDRSKHVLHFTAEADRAIVNLIPDLRSGQYLFQRPSLQTELSACSASQLDGSKHRHISFLFWSWVQ